MVEPRARFEMYGRLSMTHGKERMRNEVSYREKRGDMLTSYIRRIMSFAVIPDEADVYTCRTLIQGRDPRL